MTTKDFVLDNGLHSISVTISPSDAPTLAGLWALIFEELRAYRSYLESYFILLICTTTVFCAFSIVACLVCLYKTMKVIPVGLTYEP